MLLLFSIFCKCFAISQGFFWEYQTNLTLRIDVALQVLACRARVDFWGLYLKFAVGPIYDSVELFTTTFCSLEQWWLYRKYDSVGLITVRFGLFHCFWSRFWLKQNDTKNWFKLWVGSLCSLSVSKHARVYLVLVLMYLTAECVIIM